MRTQLQATWTGLGLWLGWLAVGTTARAEDKPPVLVGYVKKLVPDRDGGDREVGVEKVQIAMKGTGNWVGSDAHGLFRVQLLRSTRIGQSIEVEVEARAGPQRAAVAHRGRARHGDRCRKGLPSADEHRRNIAVAPKPVNPRGSRKFKLRSRTTRNPPQPGQHQAPVSAMLGAESSCAACCLRATRSRRTCCWSTATR